MPTSAAGDANETDARTTGPDARLYRKGAGIEAQLCFMGRVLIANRNAYVIDTCFTFVDGHAERIAALAKIEPRADRPNRITRRTVDELRAMNMTPLMAQGTAA